MIEIGMGQHEMIDEVGWSVVVADVIDELLPVSRVTAVHDVDVVPAIALVSDRDGVAALVLASLKEVDLDEVRHVKHPCGGSPPSAKPQTSPCRT